MLTRIWAARVVLAFSWLISGVITSEPINASSVLAQKVMPFSQPTNQTQISVSKVEFGMRKVDSKGKATFIPTTRVPLEEGITYGWRIKLKDYQGEVKWWEILRLPKPPQTWGTDNGEDFSISRDGTTVVTRRTQSASDGVIENFWTIAPGDPVGKHKMEVYIDDRMIGSFQFEIIPAMRL
jgi:hypothetical protein